MKRLALADVGVCVTPTVGSWRPVLDSDGLLRFRGRWTAISDAQLPVVELLVDRFEELVGIDDVSRSYPGRMGSSSIHALIARVRARVAEVGLALRSVRGRGVVLEAARVVEDSCSTS